MSGTGSRDRKLKQGHLDEGSFSVMGLMRESWLLEVGRVSEW